MNKLIAISIASASIAIGTIPAVAEVDAKTHKLCLEAKDYLGCVKAMKGETSSETVISKYSSKEQVSLREIRVLNNIFILEVDTAKELFASNVGCTGRGMDST